MLLGIHTALSLVRVRPRKIEFTLASGSNASGFQKNSRKIAVEIL